ncbi:MAG: hypothetical protein KC776_26300 [Myxococcales bacterium]|nr:hypothetical protein [Myxococcales bacterium]MCB9579088.1 hypothetical protein [Polyangiaceae bacterium]
MMLRRRLGTFFFLGWLGAEALAPRVARAAEPAAAEKSRGTVVVIVDVFEDETDNAKLRAKLYETAREKGYQPDPKADVVHVATDVDAIDGGRVSTDPDKLAIVQKGLGAALLVRVSKTDAGVSVVLAKQSGNESKSVASAEEVPAAVAALLGVAPATKPAPEATPAPAAEAPGQGAPQAAGYILPNEEDEGPPPDSPEAIRAAWENRGGVKATYGIRAMMTGLLIPDVQYIDRNPVSTELEVGKKNTYGIGGGIGAHVSFLFMPLPKPGEGKGWQGFRIGAGLDLNVLYVRPPVGYTYHLSNNQLSSRDTQYENKAFLYAIVPLQLGVQFGLGDFRATNLWRGVALGLAYSPAVITTLEIGQNQDKAQTNFNYGGVELDLDITKLESAENANSQIRLFAMLLPKVNDKVPWLASAGIGAVWY